MPDLDLDTAAGVRRVLSFLHKARPLLINLGERGAVDARRMEGSRAIGRRPVHRHTGPWELPAIGIVPSPAAVFVRPEGYVAWVEEGTTSGLTEALTTWFS